MTGDRHIRHAPRLHAHYWERLAQTTRATNTRDSAYHGLREVQKFERDNDRHSGGSVCGGRVAVTS
jgi:hypothetical protein